MVLALLALAVAWAFQSRPSRLSAAVVALRSQLLQARFEAIESNSPVAVVYREADDTFVTLAAAGMAIEDTCVSGEALMRLEVKAYRGVRVKSVPEKGLVWLPSGTGRTCSGAGAFNQTIALLDSAREARVIVSRAGRVRSELDR